MSWRLPLSFFCWICLGAIVFQLTLALEPTIPPTIIIDAGSSGTRLYMFEVRHHMDLRSFREIVPSKPIQAEPGLTSFIRGKTEPGLTSFIHSFGVPKRRSKPTVDTKGVFEYLTRLTDAARKHFPLSTTPINPRLFFKATAGFRILYEEVPNTLLEHIADALAKTTFEFDRKNVEVCPGNKEGVFAYMGINYMIGQLKPEVVNSYGVLELGGVSTQIAFKPQGPIWNGFDFYVDGDLIKIYSYGYDRLGKDEAFRRSFRELAEGSLQTKSIIDHPCVLKGSPTYTYKDGRNFTGSGNPELCLKLVYSLLKCSEDDETYQVPPSPIQLRANIHAFAWNKLHRRGMFNMPSPCRIMQVRTPPISGNFYALKGFFYTVYNMGLVGWNDSKQFTPRDIRQEAFTYCKKDYSEAVANGNSSGRLEKHVYTTCFDAMLVYCLLSAYGFKDHGPTFALKVRGSVADWSLGAALYESHFLNLEMNKENLVKTVLQALKKEYEPHIRYFTAVLSVLVIVFARKFAQMSAGITRIEAALVVVRNQNDGIADAAEVLVVPGAQ